MWTNSITYNYLPHGSVAESISGFSLTKENYCEAIKLLKERYGNIKQVVISSQMDSLLKLPKATSMGEVKKLRNIYDKLESHACLKFWCSTTHKVYVHIKSHRMYFTDKGPKMK